MIFQGKNQHPVREVVLHTSATSGDWAFLRRPVKDMLAEIRRWHQKRGWKREGYHYIVGPDGSYAEGRPLTMVGAHVKERNRGTIGICMIPSRTHNGIKKFSNYFTKAQRKTVRRLIAEIGGIEKVTGHNQYANKECPGFKVRSKDWLSPDPWWRGVINFILKLLRRKTNAG